jgi:hypothetical protein
MDVLKETRENDDVASSLAMQLQVSVERLTLFQGPERFYWPFAQVERLDLNN